MKVLFVVLALAPVLASPMFAQEKEDFAEEFTRVTGGAVYDEKFGVDGSAISEDYQLTHVTCTNGSKTLRVLLPLGLEDDETFFKMDGETSTLKKSGSGYTADFLAYGKRISKQIVMTPINDPKSHYKKAFEITLTIGEPLWNAMRDKAGGKAKMMIGRGGTPVELPASKKFSVFLKSCGING